MPANPHRGAMMAAKLWAELDEHSKRATALKIAQNLVKFGYTNVTADYVLKEIASTNRTVISMFAVDILIENGFTDLEGA